MTKDEMLGQKYDILFEALCLGIILPLDNDWDLIFDKGVVHEVCMRRREYGKDVSRKSSLTLNEFFTVYKNIPFESLKTIYGNIKLHKLQNRLMADNK